MFMTASAGKTSGGPMVEDLAMRFSSMNFPQGHSPKTFMTASAGRTSGEPTIKGFASMSSTMNFTSAMPIANFHAGAGGQNSQGADGRGSCRRVRHDES
jgi:hypothetical protein